MDEQRKRLEYFGRMHGVTTLGLETSEEWHRDPKHLVFRLARYKFVARMMGGFTHVAEIGCGDAFGSQIVSSAVEYLTVYDVDPKTISEVHAKYACKEGFFIREHDITKGELGPYYDGIFMLDVLEHIPFDKQGKVMKNVVKSLVADSGICIIGVPSEESQKYASEISRSGHVNCKSGEVLRLEMMEYFRNVFIFGMNDEVVHTGHYGMCHYLFALCVGPIKGQR